MQYNNPMLKNLRRTFLDPLRGITNVVYIILLQYFMLYEQYHRIIMIPNQYRVAVTVL
jgi:hypothetical protein